MKIIYYGKLQPKQLECKRCHTGLEYTPYDVKIHTNQFHKYFYVICPVCGKWCFVSDNGDELKE